MNIIPQVIYLEVIFVKYLQSQVGGGYVMTSHDLLTILGHS